MNNVLVKVDPKAWFTNERTFLHWLNMAMIVSTAALASAPDVGYEVSLISFAVIALSLYKYNMRSGELRSASVSYGKSDFMDIYSPVIIVSILTVGVLIAITIAVQKWEASRYS